MGWVQHFDDDDWEAWPAYGISTWDGSKWNSGLYGIQHRVSLQDIGTWTINYRPTKLRVTFTGGGQPDIQIFDEIGDGLTAFGPHFSGDIIEIDSWGSDDIRYFAVNARPPDMGNAFSVTNIEFYEAGTVCSEALDGILLQAETLEHYIKTMAPSLYGFNTRNVQQMIDLDAKIPALQDSDLARRNADYFRKLSDQWVHWTEYDKEARKNLI